ncbi:putative toxin, partial [Acinetobacter sp. 3657]|uniref:putative toxin n=1 Tax=Acinetobacter sp. 3657 TaxID=2817764 RepID=UPI0028673268|nr:hypothetical protein [Prolinoborus sp. 3657]
AASGMGASGVFDDALGTTASPYAYALAGANIASTIEDKWFGGSKPDYLNVSMAAIANTVGRQFAEKAESWFGSENKQYKSNISVYNSATGERTSLGSSPLYAYSGRDFINDFRDGNWSSIRDGIREELFDYKPNNNQERTILMMSQNVDIKQLSPIRIQAESDNNWIGDPNIEHALDGVGSFLKYASKFTPLGLVQQDIPFIANGARSVQTFMNNRVADITNVRDNGDSATMVVSAAVSRPFMRMAQGAVNGVAGLVELGTDPNSRATAWSGIKTFAEHPIDNTATGVSNYWNNTSWNEKLEGGFVGLYGAGLGGGTKLVSRFDTSPVISFDSVPSRFGQAGQIGLKLSPNPKLLGNDSVPNFAEMEWSRFNSSDKVDYGIIPTEHHWRYDRYLSESNNPKSPEVWYKKAQTVWANNSNGNSFEKNVRESLNVPLGKGSKPISIEGYIPDLPVGGKFGVTDVKNVQNLSNSAQLQAFYNYAVEKEMKFNLIIGPRTRSISEPLLDNIRNTNGKVRIFDPNTERFTPVDIGTSGFWRK